MQRYGTFVLVQKEAWLIDHSDNGSVMHHLAATHSPLSATEVTPEAVRQLCPLLTSLPLESKRPAHPVDC
jgi:hypothetical protein